MLKLGFIGCGSIGRDHIERVTRTVAGATVAGVFDVVPEAAQAAVDDFGLDATIFASDTELIDSPDIDAIVVASRNDAHLAPILHAISVGKNVLSEKPLTTSAQDSRAIVDAEVAAGRRFVQVGFNRRYDPGYIQLKEIVDSGEIGALLLSNCRHYNVAPATAYYQTDNVINDTLIHELDIMRHLFGESYKSIEIKIGRRNSLNPAAGLDEPQLAIFEMASGALITVEVNINCQYGYDIQCRLVGEKGIVSLPDVATPEVRLDGQIRHSIDKSWTNRFIDSYNREFQAFIDSVTRANTPPAPSAWDGYAASVAADAALASLHGAGKVDVVLPERPALYGD
ncbi:MAG: Gfo/Idh/MocA family protein [Cellulomonadaceae bacterium]